MKTKEILKNKKDIETWLSKLDFAYINQPLNVEIRVFLDDKEFKEITEVDSYKILYKSSMGYDIDIINEDKLIT